MINYYDVLRHKVYGLSGRFYDQQKLLEHMPWGEVDWQSGVERWAVTWHALFEGKHDLLTSPTRVPEAHLFVDANSIDVEDDMISFKALVMFKYNFYFTDNIFFNELDGASYPRRGLFSDNFTKTKVGDFEVLDLVDPSELVSWIYDLEPNIPKSKPI